MRTTSNGPTAAFTPVEFVVVILVILVIAVFVTASIPPRRSGVKPISCINNLKEIGTAYRIWANDNGEKLPFEAAATNGGWNELLSRGNAGAYCWTNYAIMGNEIGQYTKILVCPSDERLRAADFSRFTNNTSLSYFFGPQANDAHPQSILGGDRNLGPGTVPDREYGFSPSNGQGNDVVVNGPVCWSLKMHSAGNSAGAGNILLGDGSVQQTTSGSLRMNWLPSALNDAQARAHATNSVGIRLIFP